MLRLKSSFSDYHLIVLVATLALYCGGCALSRGQTEISRSDETKPPLQSVGAKSSTPSLDNQSLEIQSPALPIDKQSDVKGIPKVDFKNFTYSATKDLSKMIPSQTYKVMEGTYSFRDRAKDIRVEISYLDTIYAYATGKDSSPSAIVVFTIFSGGYADVRTHCVNRELSVDEREFAAYTDSINFCPDGVCECGGRCALMA
jgi:hypothetical protein